MSLDGNKMYYLIN